MVENTNKNEIIKRLSNKLKTAMNSKQKIKKNNQSLHNELVAERKKNYLLTQKIEEIKEQIIECNKKIYLRNEIITSKEKDILELNKRLNTELKNTLEFEWISLEKSTI